MNSDVNFPEKIFLENFQENISANVSMLIKEYFIINLLIIIINILVLLYYINYFNSLYMYTLHNALLSRQLAENINKISEL